MRKIFTLSEEHNPNYLPRVVKITEIKPHPNADKLVKTVVDGFDVVVSKDTKVGDVVFYFPLECQINEDFLAANNLFDISEYERNYNALEVDVLLRKANEMKIDGNVEEATKVTNEAKRMVGFFSKNRRVRCANFRGEPSQGFVIPAEESLRKWKPNLNVNIEDFIGVDFDCIDGDKLAKKYIPFIPVQQPSNGHGNNSNKRNKKLKRFDRLVEGQFNFHVDTNMFNKNYHKILPSTLVSITEKVHGTSSISAKVLVKRELNILEKVKKFFGFKVKTLEYGYINSSKNTIKNRYINKGVQNGFYKIDVWGEADKILQPYLEDGMTFYYEIVGFLPNQNKFIQKQYDYGCESGSFAIKIYRITETDNLGNVTEWPMKKVQEWTVNKGLTPVNQLFYGTFGELYPDIDISNKIQSLETQKAKLTEDILSVVEINNEINSVLYPWQEEVLARLKKDERFYMEQDSPHCKNKVPHEGIVLRFEHENKLEVYKLKCQRFYDRESKELDKGEVDIESMN